MAFFDEGTNVVDLNLACERLLRREEEMPPLHRLRLIACTDPTDLPQSRVETIMTRIDNVETCMYDFINGISLELASKPIPPPKSLQWKKVWWSDSLSDQQGQVQEDGSPMQVPDGVAEEAEIQHDAGTIQGTRRSRARKAREALSDRWQRVKEELSEIFTIRRSTMYPEPAIIESVSSENVYVESPRASAEPRPPPDRNSAVSEDLSRYQVIASDAHGNDDVEREPLLSRWSSSTEETTRNDSATTRFFWRASSTLGLTKFGRRLRRSRG